MTRPERLSRPDKFPARAHEAGDFAAIADATAEPEEPKDETSFHTLLLELDDMEQGIKTDFDDLLRAIDTADNASSQLNAQH